MRKTFLVAIVLAGLAAVPVTMAASNNATLRNYHTKIQDLAFCEKGFEIASSFPSYASRNFADEHKEELVLQADRLSLQQSTITKMLETRIRDEGVALGVPPEMYNSILDHYRTKAELKAVRLFSSTETPDEALGQLNEICSKHLK